MSAVIEMQPMPPSLPIMSVQAVTARINAIQEVTRAKMIENVHYGIIPGTKKPTLFKAGSELLLTMFNIGPQIRVEDLSTPERIKYRVVVLGIHSPTGNPIGEGVGECSSNEDKYKWRSALCDAEFEETPLELRRLKWAKGTGGSLYQAKQIRTNADDLGNTVLKMAKKRAQIDMTLTALGVSDLFNQDIEDLPPELRPSNEEGGPAASAAALYAEHPDMKAAKTTGELAKIMTALKQDEKKKFAAHFNARRAELTKEAK